MGDSERSLSGRFPALRAARELVRMWPREPDAGVGVGGGEGVSWRRCVSRSGVDVMERGGWWWKEGVEGEGGMLMGWDRVERCRLEDSVGRR